MMASEAPAGRSARDAFYVWYAALLLVVLFAGFARTFFLRGFFFDDSLPGIVQAHGVVGTAWFGFFLAQAALVKQGRTDLHRKLGVTGTVVAGSVLLVGVVTAVGVAPRILEAQIAAGAEADRALLSDPGRWVQVVRDTLAFVAFAVLAAFAFARRRRPQAHKRLMILASVALSTAGVARVFRWPALSFVPEIVGLFGGIALLIALPMLHDRRADGRIHPTLKWGGPLLFGYIVSIVAVLPLLFMR
jgi:uncharacterized membrane protein YozB (DUF420 family)